MKTLEIKTITISAFFRALKVYGHASLACGATTTDYGWIRRAEPGIISAAVKILCPKVILEIGTHKGETTLGLASDAPRAKVYTVDIFQEMAKDISVCQEYTVLPRKEVGRAFKNRKTNIVQLFGDSRDPATYSVIDRKVDLAFIDGNHSFDAVIKDSQNVLRLMKRKSFIFWHDFTSNFVSQVPEALGCLMVEEGLEIFHIKNTWLAFCLLGDRSPFRQVRPKVAAFL